MKKYIRNSNQDQPVDEFKDLVRIFRFTIDVIYEESNLISASSIEPLRDDKGVYNEVALNEYNSFLINALGIFDYHDFDVIEEHDSPYSESYYAALVKKDQVEKADYKYILFVRLSDHDIRKEAKKGRTRFHNDEAERLKQPTSKTKQLWKFKEIVVNKNTFDSYEAALDYIDKQLRSLD